jgi:hypothetical protein
MGDFWAKPDELKIMRAMKKAAVKPLFRFEPI